jgi:hypothetical protein
MILFARASQQRQVDRYLTELAIAHNPYGDSEMVRKRLFTELRTERARLVRGDSGGVGGRARRQEGIKISDLTAALGPIKRVTLTPEEMAARLRPRGAPVP